MSGATVRSTCLPTVTSFKANFSSSIKVTLNSVSLQLAVSGAEFPVACVSGQSVVIISSDGEAFLPDVLGTRLAPFGGFLVGLGKGFGEKVPPSCDIGRSDAVKEKKRDGMMIIRGDK